MPRAPRAAKRASRGFVFTIHAGHLGLGDDAADTPHKLNEHLIAMRDRFDPRTMRMLACQLEQGGNTDRFHLQGCVWFKHESSLETAKAFVGAGEAPQFAKGNLKSNFEYCTKSDTKVYGYDTVVCGNVPNAGQGARRDLTDALELCKERGGLKKVIEEHPGQYVRYCNGFKQVAAHYAAKRIPFIRDITTVVLHGDPNGGKSYAAFQSDVEDEIYPIPLSAGKSTWFDGYQGERTLLFEDYRGNVPFGDFLRLLDGYKLQVGTKGAHVPAAWSRIVITTNVDPKDWYRSINTRGMEQNRWSNEFDNRVGPLERRINEIWHVDGEWDKGAVWTQVKPPPFTEEDAEFIAELVSDLEVTPPSPRDMGERPAYFRRDNEYETCLYCGKETGLAYCDQACMDLDLAAIADSIRSEHC